MCSQPSSARAAGATVGPRTRISSSAIADVGSRQRPAGRADPRLRLRRTERADLRAGLGQPVGLDDRGAAPERLLEHLRRHRPAADQQQPRLLDGGTCVEQADELGRDQRDDGRLAVLERGRDPVEVEAGVDHGPGPVDRGPEQDRQSADVVERQAAEPAVVPLDPEVEGAPERAPEVVARGQQDRLRRAGRAAAEHAGQRQGRVAGERGPRLPARPCPLDLRLVEVDRARLRRRRPRDRPAASTGRRRRRGSPRGVRPRAGRRREGRARPGRRSRLRRRASAAATEPASSRSVA